MNLLGFRLDLVDNALDVSRIGDIGGVAVGGATGRSDGFQGRLQPLKGPRDAGDRRSGGSHSDRDRPANAARGARDQRHLSRQIDATACRTRDRSVGHDRDILWISDWVHSTRGRNRTGNIITGPNSH
jgi:hypothetical protein